MREELRLGSPKEGVLRAYRKTENDQDVASNTSYIQELGTYVMAPSDLAVPPGYEAVGLLHMPQPLAAFLARHRYHEITINESRPALCLPRLLSLLNPST